MPNPAKPDFPTFRERAPWWGADLQTLRNVFFAVEASRPGSGPRRIGLPVSDGTGDVLACHLEQPPPMAGDDCPRRELVVLIHGLSGSAESQYIHASTRYWLDRGHPVARLDLRGAGASGPSCRFSYHAGRSEDLRAALVALDIAEPGLLTEGVAIVGYSLGGNMILKFLAEFAADFPVRWAGSVSAPIDLGAASRRFGERRNHFYQRHILDGLRQESLREGASIAPEERAAVLAAQSVFEFDEHYVAPRNDFKDAADYYARCSALGFLAEIPVPTLLIHAANDPWIPVRAYADFDWRQNRNLVPLVPAGGGHVGFHGREHSQPWHDICLGLFADAQHEATP